MILPTDLTELNNWVTWRYERKENGDETKVPYSIDGQLASSTNPNTWTEYDSIRHMDRLGFVFRPEDGIMGVDLDDCIENGSLKEWAQPIVEKFAFTYMEVSPSSEGIKIFLRGKLPGSGIKRPCGDGLVEIYASGRYFTVTGRVFNNAPLAIENCQAELDWLLGHVNAPQQQPPLPLNAFDMPSFIAKYGPSWRIKGPYNNTHPVGGLRWKITNGCPFQPNYLAGSPTLGVTANGAATFTCFCGDHDQKNWHDLTVLLNARSPKRVNGHPEPPEEPDTPIDFQKWPSPLTEVAYHGLLGQIVRALTPHTEADPAAVLFQALVMIGNILGRSAHFTVESTNHYCNEFLIIVGATAKGRKGSSYNQIRHLLREVNDDWAKYRTGGSMSSGEGLIFTVRDEVKELKNRKSGPKEEVTDAGEPDKRFLVVEEELSGAISSMSREGNTLSQVVRQAWDSPDILAPMTKNNRIRATAPHVSIIGHITREELLRSLKSVQNTNGFANRFLWCCAKRSQSLPFGSQVPPDTIFDLSTAIRKAITKLSPRPLTYIPKLYHFDSEAREIWEAAYSDLGRIPGGQVGAILSRAEAHVRRIATIYAVLDQANIVTADHLCAALEVWRYSRASVEWVFGTGIGDPSSLILTAIDQKPDGLTKTEISALFNRKYSKEVLTSFLAELLRANLIVEEVTHPGRQKVFVYRRSQ